VKQKISPVFNSTEMQKRWKALFSKEIASDSISYTVKPGDSLYVIARKNHTTADFIKRINDLKSDDIYPRMKLKIHTAPFSILVDKSKNTLVLYSNNEPVKKYSVATGKKNCTPAGEFKITDKLVNPTWFKTGAILPPGSPENALGTRWMGFDKPAYGIHGTIEPKSIGTQASEGCIRMLNEDVEEIYSIVPVGTKVTVQD
jgi:lipoprotein-anchoring transpeptidase ErfK/SrfK